MCTAVAASFSLQLLYIADGASYWGFLSFGVSRLVLTLSWQLQVTAGFLFLRRCLVMQEALVGNTSRASLVVALLLLGCRLTHRHAFRSPHANVSHNAAFKRATSDLRQTMRHLFILLTATLLFWLGLQSLIALESLPFEVSAGISVELVTRTFSGWTTLAFLGFYQLRTITVCPDAQAAIARRQRRTGHAADAARMAQSALQQEPLEEKKAKKDEQKDCSSPNALPQAAPVVDSGEATARKESEEAGREPLPQTLKCPPEYSSWKSRRALYYLVNQSPHRQGELQEQQSTLSAGAAALSSLFFKPQQRLLPHGTTVT